MSQGYQVPIEWKMTMERGDQNTDLFNENLIVIVAVYREIGDQIAKECKRRNILHSYSDHLAYMGDFDDGYLVYNPRYKIKIKETGLKVQELAEWALDKFNTEDNYNIRNVWIEIQDQKK